MRKLAADQLLAEHEPALRNFLGARCRDAEMTAELLQEVAVRLVAAAPRLTLNGNARGYLFRIAANVWHDYLRRELVRRRTAVALESAEPALADAADARLLEGELRAAIRNAIRSLPVAQREVVELATCDGSQTGATRLEDARQLRREQQVDLVFACVLGVATTIRAPVAAQIRGLLGDLRRQAVSGGEVDAPRRERRQQR